MLGGKRIGAGAKPKRGVRKQSLTIGITPTLREYLDSREGSISERIESIIRKTVGFQRWESARNSVILARMKKI